MNNAKWSETTLAVAAVLGVALIVVLTLVNVGNGSQYSKSKTQTSQESASDEQSMLGLILHAKPRPLPDLTFLDGSERSVRLSDFQGKVVLLNIWATWCPPCREEMPALDRLEARLGGSSFEVVPLSIDSGGVALVASFYQAAGLMSLGVFIDVAQGAMSKLSVVGVPTTLLIDRQGGEVGRVTGPAEWDEQEILQVIEELITAPASETRTLPRMAAAIASPTDRAATASRR